MFIGFHWILLGLNRCLTNEALKLIYTEPNQDAIFNLDICTGFRQVEAVPTDFPKCFISFLFNDTTKEDHRVFIEADVSDLFPSFWRWIRFPVGRLLATLTALIFLAFLRGPGEASRARQLRVIQGWPSTSHAISFAKRAKLKPRRANAIAIATRARLSLSASRFRLSANNWEKKSAKPKKKPPRVHLSRLRRFRLDSLGFPWVLPSFTEYYRLLPAFPGFYWLLMDFTCFYWHLNRFY